MNANSSSPASRRQHGVVLLIALVALVAMTLAGIGFIKTVSTGQVLAGNMAFNRAAVSISDVGMEAARAVLYNLEMLGQDACGGVSCLWKSGDAIVADGVAANPNPSGRYFAANDPNFDYRVGATNWNNAYVVPPLVCGPPATAACLAQQQALNGYEIRYFIHRMCELAWADAAQDGAPVRSGCVSVAVQGGENQGGINRAQRGGSQTVTVPVYRVTIRVQGPRNSLAYVNVWMS